MSFPGFENIETDWKKRVREIASKQREPEHMSIYGNREIVDSRVPHGTHRANEETSPSRRSRKIYLPVSPMGAPRMNAGDKKSRRKGYPARPIVQRYAAFCASIRSHWPEDILYPTCNAWIVFYLPMPKSWSKKKRAEMCYRLHEGKPDKNNLEKALEDAKHYRGDDSGISDNRVSKLWAPTGWIEVYLDALSPVEDLIHELRENRS